MAPKAGRCRVSRRSLILRIPLLRRPPAHVGSAASSIAMLPSALGRASHAYHITAAEVSRAHDTMQWHGDFHAFDLAPAPSSGFGIFTLPRHRLRLAAPCLFLSARDATSAVSRYREALIETAAAARHDYSAGEMSARFRRFRAGALLLLLASMPATPAAHRFFFVNTSRFRRVLSQMPAFASKAIERRGPIDMQEARGRYWRAARAFIPSKEQSSAQPGSSISRHVAVAFRSAGRPAVAFFDDFRDAAARWLP